MYSMTNKNEAKENRVQSPNRNIRQNITFAGRECHTAVTDENGDLPKQLLAY